MGANGIGNGKERRVLVKDLEGRINDLECRLRDLNDELQRLDLRLQKIADSILASQAGRM